MNTPLPVSLYCVWQWWEEHYQAAHGRPDKIDFDWLDSTWMGRQRWLFDLFGDLEIGQAAPALDRNFVSLVMPYHCMIVPVILGMPVSLKAIGGYNNHPLSVAQLAALRPVDLANSPVGELLAAEHAIRMARYGCAVQAIDLASPVNNAFLLRGNDFYLDLLADPGLTRHYLEVITETMLMAYRFIGGLFGRQHSQPLGNCNVVMISPALYTEMLRPFDIRFIREAAANLGMSPICDLHHCNVPTQAFAEAYAAIPGLRSLQGSVRTDIKAVQAALPGVRFSGMVNPADLVNRGAAGVLADIESALVDGVNDLAVWDMDPSFTPVRLGEFLRSLSVLAKQYNREPQFSFIQITWEEMDWEFPRYRN